MMATVLTSPFAASSSAKRLPARKVGTGKLVIRVSDVGATDKVIFRTHPTQDVTATAADGFLKAGESVEIRGISLVNGDASDVTILATSGTPDVYFGVV
jgi:hypothetical protein